MEENQERILAYKKAVFIRVKDLQKKIIDSKNDSNHIYYYLNGLKASKKLPEREVK